MNRTTVLAVGLVVVAALLSLRLHAQATGSDVATGVLTGGQVVPAVATGAFGTGTLFVTRSLRTIGWRFDVYNVPSGVTSAHLHVGSAGINGPVVANLNVIPNLSNDFATAGTVFEDQLQLRPEEGLRSLDDVLQAAAGGALYVDFHTASRPNGEVRAQMCGASNAVGSITGFSICEGPANRF